MTECICVKEKAPQHDRSPGVVADDEDVLLVLLNPDQWKDGNFTSAAFRKDWLQKGQLSVCRVEYASKAIVKRFIVDPQVARDPKRSLVGGAVARTGNIRAIQCCDGQTRMYCVVDDPVFGADETKFDHCDLSDDDFLGHAHLGFSEPTSEKGFWKGNCRAAALAELTDAFQARGAPLQLDQIFDSREENVRQG